MNEKMKLAVEEEREEGQQRLQLAVQQTLKNSEIEKNNALSEARCEEKQKSACALALAMK